MEPLPQQIVVAIQQVGRAKLADVDSVTGDDQRLAVSCRVLIISAEGPGAAHVIRARNNSVWPGRAAPTGCWLRDPGPAIIGSADSDRNCVAEGRADATA